MHGFRGYLVHKGGCIGFPSNSGCGGGYIKLKGK